MLADTDDQSQLHQQHSLSISDTGGSVLASDETSATASSGTLSPLAASSQPCHSDAVPVDGSVVPMEPHQPSRNFKKDDKNRCFQEGWYRRWRWLHWSDSLERVFCHPYKLVYDLKMMQFSKCTEPTFCTAGFCNWKDASRCFNRHEKSASHAEAIMKWGTYCAGLNVASQLNSKHLEEQRLARRMLLKIILSVRYLGRQGLPVRGHSSSEGNFQALLRLRCEDSDELRDWITRKTSFVSHDIQNEYLQLMAHHVLRTLLNRIRQFQYYSIIADEVTD